MLHSPIHPSRCERLGEPGELSETHGRRAKRWGNSGGSGEARRLMSEYPQILLNFPEMNGFAYPTIPSDTPGKWVVFEEVGEYQQ